MAAKLKPAACHRMGPMDRETTTRRVLRVNISDYVRRIQATLWYGGLLVPFCIISLVYRFQNHIPYSSDELWLTGSFQVTPLHAFYTWALAIYFVRLRRIRSTIGCFVLIGLGTVAATICVHAIASAWATRDVVGAVIVHAPVFIVAVMTVYCAIFALRSRARTFGMFVLRPHFLASFRSSIDAIYASFRIRRQNPTEGFKQLAIALGLTIAIVVFLALLAAATEFCQGSKSEECSTLPIWDNIALVAIFIALGSIRSLVREGEAALGERADLIVTLDPRPPVVFLRSFRDEEAVALMDVRRGILWVFTSLPRLLFSGSLKDPSLRNRRLEEVVVRSIRKLGPAVAIARPAAPLELGASRAYVQDVDWKAVVDKWIDRAGVILMLAGLTPGLHWELQRIFEKGKANILLCIFPPSAIEARAAALISGIADTRWSSYLNTEVLKDARVVAFLEDLIVVVASDAGKETEYEVATQLACSIKHTRISA
jgi:hypothetical protein